MRKPILLPLGKGMRSVQPLLFWICFGSLYAQPCPTILNCPQSTITYCDETANDVSLWNYPPFTYNSVLNTGNAPEAPLGLNIRVKGCNGGGLVTISYILYLDLDDDGVQETVVMSSNPPAGGTVRANNYFNPGYSGGDTVLFDQRALPDSLKFRFALETEYSADTTTGWVRFSSEHEPYDFLPVQLPEGRHRIEWRIVQDGVERFCDRNFKVKDCGKPQVICGSNLAVYLDISKFAGLNLSQALQDVSDNITPDSQLVVGMRHAGTGTGFPFDAQGNPQDTVTFNCDDDENSMIEIWARDLHGNEQHCVAQVLVYDTAGYCPFTLPPTICARPYWSEQEVGNMDFTLHWVGPNQQPVVSHQALVNSTCSQLFPLPPVNSFSLRANKDTLPLNGVTTYDLVLISKHILGTEPFNAGWKIVAADVNHSNSITTFDIVELRKLILGLNDKMPANTPSWRFFLDTCLAPSAPAYNLCPSEYVLPALPLSGYPANLSFRGVKMGDVNGSASSADSLGAGAQARGEQFVLDLPDLALQAGESVTVPIRSREGGSWTGIQYSLIFDPGLLEPEGYEAGGPLDLNASHWAVLPEGRINLSWSDAEARLLLPGDVFTRLKLKAKAAGALRDLLRVDQNGPLSPECYDKNGVLHECLCQFSLSGTDNADPGVRLLTPQPNPGTGIAHLPLRLPNAETVRVELHDVSGELQWGQTYSLGSGAHLIEFPAEAFRMPGVYVWRLWVGGDFYSGRLIRM